MLTENVFALIIDFIEAKICFTSFFSLFRPFVNPIELRKLKTKTKIPKERIQFLPAFVDTLHSRKKINKFI